MSWFTSSLMNAVLVQQREHKHAAKGKETALPLFVAARHWSYLLISSKPVLCCRDLGALVIYAGLTSDITLL